MPTKTKQQPAAFDPERYVRTVVGLCNQTRNGFLNHCTSISRKISEAQRPVTLEDWIAAERVARAQVQSDLDNGTPTDMIEEPCEANAWDNSGETYELRGWAYDLAFDTEAYERIAYDLCSFKENGHPHVVDRNGQTVRREAA